MKKLTYTLLLTFMATYTLFSQSHFDYFGNPASHVAQASAIENDRSGANGAPVIHAIPSPNQSTYIGDITFDGEYLWTIGYAEYLIHQISRVDGAIIRSLPTTVLRPHGLTFDGTHLWLSDGDNLVLHKIDTADGTVIAMYPTPAHPSSSYPAGLAWDGTLWLNDPRGIVAGSAIDSIYQTDTLAAVLQAELAKGTFPSGLAFDG